MKRSRRAALEAELARRLRVLVENPAQRRYARTGFEVVASDDGVVQMTCALRSGDPSHSEPPCGAV